MALGHGPRIVTDGLVSALDAADANSYDSTVRGQQTYTSSGEYSWTCPSGVTSVSVVCIGGGGGGNGGGSGVGGAGGGGGGGLGYKNNISVTPGQSYIVVVGGGGAGDAWDGPPYSDNPADDGGDSYFINAITVKGGGGGGGLGNSSATGGSGGTYVGDGGGNGYSGGTGSGSASLPATGGGGGSTGTYTGNATTRGTSKYISSNCTSGCLAGNGTGQGLLGTGSSGLYGRGGGANMETFANGTSGYTGAVRIMWGPDRSYPSTGVADQSISTDFNDLSGKGNGFTLSGVAYNSSTGSFTFGDNDGDYVARSTSDVIGGLTDITVEMWIKISTLQTQIPFISYNTSSSDNAFLVLKESANTLRTYFGPQVTDSAAVTFADTNWNTGNFIQFVIARSGSNIKYYIDGTFIVETNSYPTGSFPTGGTLLFGQEQDSPGGGFNTSQDFPGDYAKIVIYDRQLSASEIQQNFNALRGRYGI